MSELEDTVAEEVTETEQAQVDGTASQSVSADPSVETEEEKVDREAYEQLQKELNKTRQELNLRRNKEKEFEAEKLKETGQYKELAEKLQSELDEIKAKEEEAERQSEAEDFRKSILDQYPKQVKEIAQDLNLWWDDPQNFEEAEAQLKTKLDALTTRVGAQVPDVTQDEDIPEISSNNSATAPGELSEIDQLKKYSAKELEKILPRADAR